jgi:spore maturation protein CgeB
MNYRIVKITSFYKAFLNDYYSKNPAIKQKAYFEQYNHLMAQGHAWSDYFQYHFSKMGIDAHEIIHNAIPLQIAWAKENNVPAASDIVLAQLKKISPDVVFFQDAISFNDHYFKMIKKELPSLKFIFGHCCSPFTKDNLAAFKEMKFMLACSPGFLQIFNKHGIPCFEFLHAFEPKVLKNLQNNSYPKAEILFAGSFVKTSNTLFHDERLKYIEKIIENNLPLTIYGNVDFESRLFSLSKQIAFIITRTLKKCGLGTLNKKFGCLVKTAMLAEFPKRSIYPKDFMQRIKPPLYGLEMLKATVNAKIGFNIHAGIAGDYAANMRMFEVTGVGTLLFTDYKKNLNSIFEPGNEIITYKTIDECISKLKWALNNPESCKNIAEAGQKRTLKDHTIENRVNQLNDIILKELAK